ncbi:hypothetical protein JW823_06320 [bacterium]|nr:hypothetical protein [candidate division CSSED10-310 bacterium]
MLPTFKNPSFLLLEKVDPESLHIGDVIAFRTTGIRIPVIHRIKRKDKGFVITGGDNSDPDDLQTVSFETILGRAKGMLTKHGLQSTRNGLAGMMTAHWLRFTTKIRKSVKPLILHLPRRLRMFELMTRYFADKPEMYQFRKSDNDIRIRFIWRKRTIGWYDSDINQLCFLRYYRYLMSEPHIISRLDRLSNAHNLHLQHINPQKDSSGSTY